jgi:hypothetical protein
MTSAKARMRQAIRTMHPRRYLVLAFKRVVATRGVASHVVGVAKQIVDRLKATS